MTTLDYVINKYNLKIGHQYSLEIPDMGSPQLAELFAELKFTEGAEVGVLNGDYSEILCKANPNLHLYSIDSWKTDSYPEGFLEQSHPLVGGETQKYFDDAYATAVKKLSPYNCTVIRKTSMDAVKDFKDNSLDFVYLDAGHDFLNFTHDLHYWKDKVKVGGIIAGHDYMRFKRYKMIHVKQVLEAYVYSYRMFPLFILPRRHGHPRRDAYGNWFLIKC